MSEAKSIFDGCKYLYAEQLKDRRVTLTIKSVNEITIVGDGGRKDKGYELEFVETPKRFAFSSMTVRRQLAMTLGEDYENYPGKKVVLFAVKQAKSLSGKAIRIAAVDSVAQPEGE